MRDTYIDGDGHELILDDAYWREGSGYLRLSGRNAGSTYTSMVDLDHEDATLLRDRLTEILGDGADKKGVGDFHVGTVHVKVKPDFTELRAMLDALDGRGDQ